MKRGWLIFSCAACLCLSGCAAGSGGGDKPALPQPEQTAGRAPGKSAAQLVPERLEKNESGVPMLKVYDVKNEKLETLSVEDYLPAVLAGEMAGDWPLEALKAQAILARTFVLQFVSQKESMYDGADISTDIKEAQAYDAAGVNARIREAVKETRGEVLNAGGELPYAWFHAHSGGLTARAKEGLDYEKAEPGYTQCVKGMENDEAPAEAAHWQASFSMDEVMAAAKASGVTVDKVESIAIGQRGEYAADFRKVRFRACVQNRHRLDKDALMSFGKPARGGWTGSDERQGLRPWRGHEPVGRVCDGEGRPNRRGDRDALF